MGQQLSDTDKGKPKLGEEPVRSHALSTTNPTWTALGAKTGLCGKNERYCRVFIAESQRKEIAWEIQAWRAS
jgi:hypothetical protein